MADKPGLRVHERWARLRFSVIGQLLAAPPENGALRAALEDLAAREWRHPTTGGPVRFGVSTLERWYYRARNERQDPVAVLRRKRRVDAGEQASMTTQPASGPARPVRRAQELERQATSRQPGSAGTDPLRVAAGPVLHDGAAVPAHARPEQAASTDDAADRRRAGSRGPARCPRGAQLRG